MKKDLKDARSRLNTNNDSDNYNMIYKLKLESKNFYTNFLQYKFMLF